MKFDCIIMNPPYERNLHLKILAEAITHLKNETSTCVNLSPVRWLQDPLAKYKKNSDWHRFQESVSKHIESLDVFFPKEMSDTFSIQIKTDLAIYVANSSINNNFDFVAIPNASNKSIKFIQSIYERILKTKVESIDSKISSFRNKTTSNYVLLIAIGGVQQRGPEKETHDFVRRGKYGAFIDDLFNGKTAKEIKDADKRSVWGNVDNWPLICFSSGDEAKNFFNFACTSFMRYLAWAFSSDQHVPTWALPWLGDAVNLRTGLKGYTGEWTNEDLYKFFNITPEEQKVIEETMEKYK